MIAKANFLKFYKVENLSGFNQEVIAIGSLKPNSNFFNWSDIRDKLIRLAAKYTDSYASDLINDINDIQYHLETGQLNRVYLFGFHESGVDNLYRIENVAESDLNSRYRAVWQIVCELTGGGSITMSLHKVNYNIHKEVD